MYKRNWYGGNRKKKLVGAAVLICTFVCSMQMASKGVNGLLLSGEQLVWAGEDRICRTVLPLFAFVQGRTEGGVRRFWYDRLVRQFPLAAYAEGNGICTGQESSAEHERLLDMEGMDGEYTGQSGFFQENEQAAQTKDTDRLIGREEQVAERMEAENAAEKNRQSLSLLPAQKQFLYPLEEYQDFENLVKEFYAVDQTTMADESLLNLDTLLGRDMRISDEGDGPQILIYHTHSQEGYADAVPGEEYATVVGAGDYLAELLREKGFRVLHHKGQYDVEKRDYAYTKAAPALEELLQENPSIQVVIDLHRDEVPPDTRLVTEIGGRPTARFMFFNGLSRTRKTGEIATLKNPCLQDNLAFAFQMQLACNEYYPGLTRRIYLKGYRYNMHYCPRTLLIELGAQTNTAEEAYRACEPLAAVLAHVLNGEE